MIVWYLCDCAPMCRLVLASTDETYVSLPPPFAAQLAAVKGNQLAWSAVMESLQVKSTHSDYDLRWWDGPKSTLCSGPSGALSKIGRIARSSVHIKLGRCVFHRSQFTQLPPFHFGELGQSGNQCRKNRVALGDGHTSPRLSYSRAQYMSCNTTHASRAVWKDISAVVFSQLDRSS